MGRRPPQRDLFQRAARTLGVSASDYERADILAQIAELLVHHSAIGGMLAFKGGAIMTLVDGSPRLSADLDAVVVTGGAVRERQIRTALLAELDGRRVVTDVGIVNPGRQSLQYPFVKVRSFTGLGDVNIRLEVSWREVPLIPTEQVEIGIPRSRAAGRRRPHGSRHRRLRGAWRADAPMIEAVADGMTRIYRDVFHIGVKSYVDAYFAKLRERTAQGADLRDKFKCRVNELCQESEPRRDLVREH